MVERVEVTDEARKVIDALTTENGPLLFHQSGGCCDGSAPMCYPQKEFRVGSRDVLLGTVAGAPFFIGGAQYEYWAHTHLTVDVVPGRGSGFSLESPRGVRFLTRSRLFTNDEQAELDRAGPPHVGPLEAHA
jgi:uncharacterized protein (DUF779 family)